MAALSYFWFTNWYTKYSIIITMSDYIIQRNGYYYYFRRVPKEIAEYDSRKFVKISLKTKEKNVARKRAVIHNESIEKFWRDKWIFVLMAKSRW